MSIIIWTLGIIATLAVFKMAADGMDIVEEDLNNGHH